MAGNAQNRPEIERIIREVVSERFPGGRIVSVHASRDTDFEGDPILVVQIVIDATKTRIDARQASGLTRHVRSKLAEIDVFDFPLLSFISQSEAGNMTTEPV